MKISFTFAALLLAAMLARPANAGIVIDLDRNTAGVQGSGTPIVLDPGTTTFQMAILFDASVVDGTFGTLTEGFNGLAADVAWSLGGGATVDSFTNFSTGTLSNSAASIYDVNTLGLTESHGGAGFVLDNLGLGNPDIANFDGNIGGGGYFDAGTTFFTGDAGNDGVAPDPLLELFTVDVTVTGVFGSTVDFQTFGAIEAPNAGAPIVGEDLDYLYANQFTSPNDGSFGQAVVSSGASFTAVPEPSSFAVIGLVGFAAARIRRRKA